MAYNEIEIDDIIFVELTCDRCKSFQRVVNDEQGYYRLLRDGWVVDVIKKTHTCAKCRRKQYAKKSQ